MGSAVDVRFLPGDGCDPNALGRLVDSTLARLERCWSRFDPDSELSLLNSRPDGEVEVSALLGLAIDRALVAWRLTGGAFDPTVLDALRAAGYDRSFELIPDHDPSLRAPVPVPGCTEVEVRGVPGPSADLNARTVTVLRPPGLRFDLGGIGKGLAADLVAGRLVEAGAISVQASLGGDVRVDGQVVRDSWRIPVVDPWDDSRASTIFLDRPGAVVMSSTRRRRWPTADGGWAHHIIDPRTARPSRSDLAAVVVVAAEAWWAESLAKAALVEGREAGSELLRRHGVDALLVGEDTDTTWLGAAQLPPPSASTAASSRRDPIPSLP